MSRNVESGLRDYHVEFIREPDYGDPGNEAADAQVYSDVVMNFNWSAESGNDPRRGLGNADPIEFVKSAESHEITVEYDLYYWFEDGSGNPNDASYDGLQRNVDNNLPNSHTVVAREEKSEVAPENTINGDNAKGTKIFTVATGGLIEEAALSGDTSNAGPITVELTYMPEKARSYQVDQPEGSAIVATSSGSDSMDVTIADEELNNVETVSVGGSATTETYSDIGGIWLAEEPTGTITISEDTGDDLAVIHGSSDYQDIEGDRGIPVPSSREFETGTDAEVFTGSTISRGGTEIPHQIVEATLTVGNNVEEMEVSDSLGMFMVPGNRDLEMEASMFGEKASHDMLEDSLQNTREVTEWAMQSGNIQLTNSILQEPGERAAEEGEAVMTIDNTFEASGLTINTN